MVLPSDILFLGDTVGMFDYVKVVAPCWNCDRALDSFQSKDSSCLLRVVAIDEVDNYYTICEQCSAWVEYSRTIDGDFILMDKKMCKSRRVVDTRMRKKMGLPMVEREFPSWRLRARGVMGSGVADSVEQALERERMSSASERFAQDMANYRAGRTDVIVHLTENR